MSSTSELISEIAGAILDGRAIDWDSVESTAGLDQRPLLHRLRRVATVANLYRVPAHGRPGAADGSSPPATAGDPTGTLAQWGHLRVLEPIGRGAFGDVYRAWDTKLDREVALKLLPENGSRADPNSTAIVDEGRLLGRVRHPNVVTIYGADRIERRTGLWMEFVRGRTLQQALEQGKSFSAKEAAAIGIELAHAIAAVHAAGLLHRDIKPHNVMLAEDGRVVLMDFGTGRDRQDRSSPELAGTPLYLAPEVLCEGKVPSVSSDIYSLGVLLFYLLTRSYPVRAQGLRALRLAHERRESWDVRSVRPDVPRRLARLIARAIDPVAERRHQSASLLAAELESLSRPPTRLRLAWAAGAAAAIVPLVWLGGEIRARQSERPRVQNAALAVANTFSPAESPVIAVLPLKNLSTEPDSDIFADGLTGEIIRNLAVIRGLEVRSQTSSFAFRDRPRNLREVGDQLGAALVVEGSVLRSGNRLRINAQLVQVAGDVPLWADRFDREFKDIFAIQDEISRAIVNKLRLTLGRGQRRYDTNPEAYEQYLKARALLDRRSEPWKAAALFEQVTAGDPGFAPAYAGLASANAVIAMSPYRGTQGATIPFGDTQRIVMAAAARAVELDPLLAEAHAAMGWVSARSFDWDNADRSFRRAIELDDTLSHVYVNYVESTLHPLERHADAERLLRAALGKDPLSLDVQRELARVLMYRGRYEDAIDGFERVRAADPEFPIHHFGRALMLAGRLPEAIALLETAPGYAPWLGYAYVKAGRRAEAEKLATVHRRFPFRAANIHAALGDTDRAFEALDQMFSTEPQRLAQLLAAPEMGVLHGDPRLTALRKKLRLP